MESPRLVATKRDVLGRKVKTLRAQGQTPVVLYGHATDTKSLTVDTKTFGKLVRDAGFSTLIDLVLDDAKPVKVLVQDAQYDNMTGSIIHADLFQVKMDEKLETEIPLSFVGESPAVKDQGGNLITAKSFLNIEAFPQDLVSEIEVDLSVLTELDTKLTVGDIKVPTKITVLDDPDEAIVIVNAPRTEEELEAELAPTTAEEEAAAVAATAEASTEKPAEEEAAE